jgi:hypothetical protein
VVNADSNLTVSLSVYMFFAPTLLWLGATRRGFPLASTGRRGGAINRGLVVTGLLHVFGVTLASSPTPSFADRRPAP